MNAKWPETAAAALFPRVFRPEHREGCPCRAAADQVSRLKHTAAIKPSVLPPGRLEDAGASGTADCVTMSVRRTK